jgi:mRNA cleavage and polyadenylation factor CLP1 P-loop
MVQGRGPGAAGQGSLTPPGTICATPCEAPIDVEDGLAVEVPLVYYFGHVSPSENDVSGIPGTPHLGSHLWTSVDAVRHDSHDRACRRSTDRASHTWVT